MRVLLSQWDSLSPAERKLVTHVEIDDPEKPVYLKGWFASQYEEYPGEASSRGVTERGFNK